MDEAGRPVEIDRIDTSIFKKAKSSVSFLGECKLLVIAILMSR